MSKEIIKTTNAPAAIGPYNQAIKINNLIFTAGQIPIDPETGKLLDGDITIQAKQVMKNLKAVLEAAGSSFEKVIKATIFMKDMNDYVKINEVYANYFTQDNAPARSAVEVSRLPKDVLVEIEMIASVE